MGLDIRLAWGYKLDLLSQLSIHAEPNPLLRAHCVIPEPKPPARGTSELWSFTKDSM